MNRAGRVAVVAWLVTAVYYFYQYALRSAPAVIGTDSTSATSALTIGGPARRTTGPGAAPRIAA